MPYCDIQRPYESLPMIWESLPTITSDRLTLRQLTEVDIDSLDAIFANQEVMRYWSTPPLTDTDAARELLADIQRCYENQTMLKWGVARNTDGALIGTTTLFHIELSNHRAEIGYALVREQWGKGYMNEALNALIRWSFEVLDLHRIEADVDPRNQNSIRTLERLGFQREGYLRERWQVNGEIQDSLFYGLLRREWKHP
jgi:RimJ/RimL family protein N-acetyltransferase